MSCLSTDGSTNRAVGLQPYRKRRLCSCSCPSDVCSFAGQLRIIYLLRRICKRCRECSSLSPLRAGRSDSSSKALHCRRSPLHSRSNFSMDNALSIAYYCTGHGLGHVTRTVEVCKQLVERGHSVTLMTAAQSTFFGTQLDSRLFHVRKAVLDCGSQQVDAFTVDGRASLEQYDAACVGLRSHLIHTEVDWLQENHIDIVASDIVPLACAAAAEAGIPCVAVSNFSWGELREVCR